MQVHPVELMSLSLPFHEAIEGTRGNRRGPNEASAVCKVGVASGGMRRWALRFSRCGCEETSLKERHQPEE